MKKLEIIKKVRELYGKCLSKSEIGRHTSLDYRTSGKYISMEGLPQGVAARNKSSILDEYINKISIYAVQGISGTKIYKIIK